MIWSTCEIKILERDKRDTLHRKQLQLLEKKPLPSEKQLPHFKGRLQRQRNNRKWHNRKELHWTNWRNF